MMSSSFPKAMAAVATMAAVVAVLAATAEAAGSYYIPTLATPGFLLSPIFLWVAANVIIVWLVVSSSRRPGKAAANDDTAAHDGGEGVVLGAEDSRFYASEYAAFSNAPPSAVRRADDAPVSSTSKRLTKEARAAARRSDRPRVRKKPVGGLDAPTTTPRPATVVAAEARDDEPAARNERRGLRGQEETAAAVAVAAAADDDEDVSMDSLWASIVQRRAARPVVVRKSESWGNEELPRLQRVAETAAAARRHQVRKSVSAVAKAAAAAAGPTTQPSPPEPSPVARQAGWRTRDVLVGISPDELLRRAESFIRRQREHLRLQRQESEQRQLQLLQRRLHAPAPPPPLIRV